MHDQTLRTSRDIARTFFEMCFIGFEGLSAMETEEIGEDAYCFSMKLSKELDYEGKLSDHSNYNGPWLNELSQAGWLAFRYKDRFEKVSYVIEPIHEEATPC